MAREPQNGRIGGGVLQDNLKIYQDNSGKDYLNFKNESADTALLHLDPINNRVGITTEAPTRDLLVPTKIKSIGGNADRLELPNYTLENSIIRNELNETIYLSSANKIQLSALATDQLLIDDDRITTSESNANIDLIPNGTGTVEVQNELRVYGNIETAGDITLDGDLIFGEGPETPDLVAFDKEINSDILLDVSDTWALGSDRKYWANLWSVYLNGEAVRTRDLSIGPDRLTLRQGNKVYVAINGDDTNAGDHQQGPFRTIKRALEFADSSPGQQVEIEIFPGEYEEEFPLTVPPNTIINGHGIRSVSVKPTVATQTNDCFLLTGETTVQNLTVKDFFYDSLNNTGHAFRFVSGAVVTNRSPYIQNVSVITQGSIAGVQHILENPDAVPTGSNDRFGSAVAIDGDYVVAAASGEQTGYVYIYNKNTGELLHSIAAPSANNDLFGYSVDVSGNYAIVGDYIDDSLGTNTGIAYIIDVTTGSVVHTLTEPSPSSNNYFGRDVAIDGNYAVVGAYGNGGNIGKAYIFNVTTGNVLHTLDNPTGLSDRRFAYNVAISGTNVLVGAQYESSGGYPAAGKVYMFSATTGSLTRTFSNPESGSSKQADYFGAGIAIDGSNIVIGADNSNLAADTGKLYFYNTSGTLIDSFVPEQDNQDAIGDVVSISGDNVVLGFYEADNRQGKVQIYSHSTSELLYEGLNPGNTSNQDFFANAVDIDGTILVVGSQSYDDGSINAAGRTFIIDIADTTTFGIGDAGRGAYIDGAEVAFVSRNASMLFHSATFITPGVDAITMTNGVRVEWLNSFTYFANRGLYAVRGATGHLSEDGSTMMYGAEIRSIGSANVYGNIGAEADGNECIMYLINHNFAYIGSGKFVDNDLTRVDHTKEAIQINDGKVYYQSTDEKGTFKVGESFFVNLDNGLTSIDASQVDFDGLSQITVSDGDDETTIGVNYVETGNIRFDGNTVFSLDGDLNIDTATTSINFLTNVSILKDLAVSDDVNIQGALITFGNEPTDTLKFNTPISQNLVPDVNSSYNLGSPTKKWSVRIDDSQIDDIKFKDNFITTTSSNSDLEFITNGVGTVNFQNVTFNADTISTVDSDLILSTPSNLRIDADKFVVPKGDNSERIEGEGDFRFNTEDNIFEGYSTGNIGIGGIFSDDRLTSITAHPTDNTINIAVNGDSVGQVNSLGLEIHGLAGDSVLFDGATISTIDSNADLDIRRNGTGSVYLDGKEYFRDNIWTNTDTVGAIELGATDNGYVKVGGTFGTVVPSNGTYTLEDTADVALGQSLAGASIITSVTSGVTVTDPGTGIGTGGFDTYRHYLFTGANTRSIVSAIYDLTDFIGGAITCKFISGNDTNGKASFRTPRDGKDLELQWSDDGVIWETISVLMLGAQATGFPTWTDFDVTLEALPSSFNPATVRFRIVQLDSSEGTFDEVAVAQLSFRYATDTSNNTELGSIRYNVGLSLLEVYNGTDWIESTGVEEDPVTLEYMTDRITLWSILLG